MKLPRVILIACVATGCVAARAPVEQRAPSVTAPASSRQIRLERPRCYGECPAYNVTLASDGYVRFEGIANVKVNVAREWRVPADSAAKVFHFADSIRFSNLPERYEFGVPGCVPFMADHAAFAVTLSTATHSKRVYADEGCANVPHALLALRGLIERTSRVEALYLRP